MISGATLFLYLLPLAAAPVIFHLLMRRRRRRIIFSTKMFFDRVHPKLTAQRKLREWLLLAARMLMIALLLLALARLVVTGFGSALGLGGKQVVVAVIDNSGSMAGRVRGGDDAKLKTALESAGALLTNMQEGAQAGVVLLVADLRAGEGGRMTSDRKVLLDYLDRVRGTAAAGNPARAFQQAVAMLKEASPAGGGTIHVFTDLQEADWKGQHVNPEDVRSNVRVAFHRVPTAPADLPNVCLVQARISSRRILPRQPYYVELLLRNDGDKDVEVRVHLQEQDQLAADTEKVTIAAGAKERVKMGFRAPSPGAHWIRTWVEGDGFSGDNRAAFCYICEPTGDIIFAGGRQAADFGVLPLAFSPGGDGRYTSLVPGFCGLGDLRDRIENEKPMLVALKWSDAYSLDGATADRLEQYVLSGGNLLVLPAAAGEEPSGDPPAWIGAGVEKVHVLPEAVPLVVEDGTSEFWADLRGPDGAVRLGGAHAKRYHPLSLRDDAGYEPLLDVGDGQTVFAVRRMGEGQITVSGMAFADRREGIPDWNTLPTRRSFVVMVQPIALGAVSGLATRNMSIVAGNALRSLPGEEDEVTITTLVGDPIEWSGPRDQTPNLVREGAHLVRVGERQVCLSVMPAEAAGSTAFITGSEVAAMRGIPHAVRDLDDEKDFRDEVASFIGGMNLYVPLLLSALAALMAEGLIGSPSLRRGARPADGKEYESREAPGKAPAPKPLQETVS